MQPHTRARAGSQPTWLRPARIVGTTLALTTLPLLGSLGCGAKTRADDADADTAATAQSAPPACASAVALAYGRIAAHIYAEFAGGRVVGPAVRRLQSSPALIAAVESANPGATRAALQPLIRGQLARVQVIAAGRTLAQYGHAEALAPVAATIDNAAGAPIGTIVASEQSARGYVDTVRSFVEAHVLVRAGSRQLAGTTTQAPPTLPGGGAVSFAGRHYAVYSFAGSRFPSTSLRVYVLTPLPRASACGRTSAETSALAIGAAAMKIYRDEQSGARARAVVGDFERSRSFQEAVASGNSAATEAAIVAFFKTRLHVVRVRATLGGRLASGAGGPRLLGGRLVADVGGPHVLAPAAGQVRDARGRVVGHFLLSIQDDQGYEILAHRFTGAQVLLRQGTQQIMGDLTPGPVHIPDRGEVVYAGVPYQAYSFVAQAFPSGALRVSLLIPPAR